MGKGGLHHARLSLEPKIRKCVYKTALDNGRSLDPTVVRLK